MPTADERDSMMNKTAFDKPDVELEKLVPVMRLDLATVAEVNAPPETAREFVKRKMKDAYEEGRIGLTSPPDSIDLLPVSLVDAVASLCDEWAEGVTKPRVRVNQRTLPKGDQ